MVNEFNYVFFILNTVAFIMFIFAMRKVDKLKNYYHKKLDELYNRNEKNDHRTLSFYRKSNILA